MTWFDNISSHFIGYLFICWWFLLLCSSFSVCTPTSLSFIVKSKIWLPQPMLRTLLPMFPSKSLISGHTFNPFKFCMWCKIVVQFHSFAHDGTDFQHHLLDCLFHTVCSLLICHKISSVTQSCPTLRHTRPLGPSPTPRACSNSCPLSQWCHPTISSSVVPFSCLQSFPASGSFPMSQLFASGDQSIRVSASASVLPTNIQDWFLLDCYKIIDQICVCLFHGLSILFHGFMCLFIWW